MPTNTPEHSGERQGRRLRPGQPSSSSRSFPGQDQQATAVKKPAETPVIGC